MLRRLILMFCVFALIIAGWLLVDVRTRHTLFRPNGFIQSGNELGVTVGDTRQSARAELLSQGMSFQESQNGGTCFFRKVRPDQQLDIFHVNSWHGGMVCVVSRNERVEEFIWAFQPVSL